MRVTIQTTELPGPTSGPQMYHRAHFTKEPHKALTVTYAKNDPLRVQVITGQYVSLEETIELLNAVKEKKDEA